MEFYSLSLVSGYHRGLRLPSKANVPQTPGSLAIEGDKLLRAQDNGSWQQIANLSMMLFPFSSHRFTPATPTGRNGPTLTQLNTTYAGASFLGNIAHFNVSGGKQLFTVPANGWYEIIATGACSAGSYSSPVRCSGKILLSAGDILTILCGQLGTQVGQSIGGSGATYVHSNAQGYLLVAGGGGGGPSGTYVSEGTPSGPINQGSPTLQYGGHGFSNKSSFVCGGGSGLIGNGGSVDVSSVMPAGHSMVGAQSLAGTAVGGYISGATQSAQGGFGGGGSAYGYSTPALGGGGGYTGGNSGRTSSNGGGSFAASVLTQASKTTLASVPNGSQHAGNVFIQYLGDQLV